MTGTAAKKAPAKKAAKKAAPAKPTNRLVSRRYGAHGHGYLLDGEKIPGVSSILKALPKSLAQWAADAGANLAVEQWDKLSQEPLTKRLDAIRYAHRDLKNEAAARGTKIHAYGERLVKGLEVDIPEEHLGPAQAYARFLDAWDIEVVTTEAPVCNLSKGRAYGGRGDLWCKIGKRDNAYALVDLKTGKNVYESTVHQCVAYDNADIWQPDGPESEQPYEPVDLIYVAHILPDDVELLPVRGAGGLVRPGPGDFRSFLYLQQVAAWLERHGYQGDEPLIGAAVRPGEPDEDR